MKKMTTIAVVAGLVLGAGCQTLEQLTEQNVTVEKDQKLGVSVKEGSTLDQLANKKAPAGEKDQKKALTVKAGASAEIKLAGNPTTGYTWVPVNLGNPAIAVVKNVEPTKSDNDNKNGMVGVPSDTVFQIQGVLAGKTTLVFEYKRVWEKDVPALQTMTVDVTVE